MKLLLFATCFLILSLAHAQVPYIEVYDNGQVSVKGHYLKYDTKTIWSKHYSVIEKKEGKWVYFHPNQLILRLDM